MSKEPTTGEIYKKGEELAERFANGAAVWCECCKGAAWDNLNYGFIQGYDAGVRITIDSYVAREIRERGKGDAN